ncbi:MAG TPA: cupin domain-containing protein [Solirubrobacteraceae bacterium]|jgi:quercetin dioxygenase-like cupin family protein
MDQDHHRDPALWHSGMRLDVLLDGAASGGRYSVLELTAPEGAGMPLHVHTREDETLIVLAGAVDAWCDGTHKRLQAPETLTCRRGVPHRFTAASAEARLLLVITPAGFEATLAAASGERPEEAVDPDDLAVLFTGAGVSLLGARP